VRLNFPGELELTPLSALLLEQAAEKGRTLFPCDPGALQVSTSARRDGVGTDRPALVIGRTGAQQSPLLLLENR
jgi:hypothetical protein